MTPALLAEDFIHYTEGTSLRYEGDSILYNDFNNSIDTVHFFYTDSLVRIDTVGEQLVYQFERFISYDGAAYQYQNNYSYNRSNQGVIRYENVSNHYILPPKFYLNSTWNGHQFQSTVVQEYTIDSMATLDFAGGFREMVRIKQIEEINLIEEEIQNEQYIEDYGLLYHYRKSVRKDINTGNIKSGSIVTLALKP